MKSYTVLFTEENIMKEIHLHEGELNVMELLWSNQVLSAKDIAKIVSEYVGWKKNTTYTVINRLIEKGAIIREEPGFLCKAAISKNEIQIYETETLIERLYDGSMQSFLEVFLMNEELSQNDIEVLKEIILKNGEKNEIND